MKYDTVRKSLAAMFLLGSICCFAQLCAPAQVLADPKSVQESERSCDPLFDKPQYKVVTPFSEDEDYGILSNVFADPVGGGSRYFYNKGGCPEMDFSVEKEGDWFKKHTQSRGANLMLAVHYAPVCRYGRSPGDIQNTYKCVVDYASVYYQEGSSRFPIRTQYEAYINGGFLTRQDCEAYEPVGRSSLLKGRGESINAFAVGTLNCRQPDGSCQTKSSIMYALPGFARWDGQTVCLGGSAAGYQPYLTGLLRYSSYDSSNEGLSRSICESDFIPRALLTRKSDFSEDNVGYGCMLPNFFDHDHGVENLHQAELQTLR